MTARWRRAFLEHWLRPRRAVSRRILSEYQAEGQLPRDYDIETVLDAMYGPLHFVLMAHHRKLSLEYAASLSKVILDGLLRARENRGPARS